MTDSPKHWRHIHRRKNEHLLFAEDVGPSGYKVDVEIVSTEVVKATDLSGTKQMPAAHLTGHRKLLGLSPTNCKTLEKLCGTPDWSRWRGWVTLVIVRVSYRDMQSGQTLETDAIRVAPDRPRRPASGGGTQKRRQHAQPDAPTTDEQEEISRLEREQAEEDARAEREMEGMK